MYLISVLPYLLGVFGVLSVLVGVFAFMVAGNAAANDDIPSMWASMACGAVGTISGALNIIVALL